MLRVHQQALDLIDDIHGLHARIKPSDRGLADQLRRAANSVVLNIAEAEYNTAGHQRNRFWTAAGSANEVRAAIRLAVAWKILPQKQCEPALRRLDVIVGMLHRLCKR